MPNRLLLSLAVPVAALMAVCLYLRYKQQQQQRRQKREKFEEAEIADEISVDSSNIKQNTMVQSSDLVTESTTVTTDSITANNSSVHVNGTANKPTTDAVKTDVTPSQCVLDEEMVATNLSQSELHATTTATTHDKHTLVENQKMGASMEEIDREQGEKCTSERKQRGCVQVVNGHYSGLNGSSSSEIAEIEEREDMTEIRESPIVSEMGRTPEKIAIAKTPKISETSNSEKNIISNASNPSEKAVISQTSAKLNISGQTETQVHTETIAPSSKTSSENGHEPALPNGIQQPGVDAAHEDSCVLDKADVQEDSSCVLDKADIQPDNASERSTDSGKGGSSSSFDHCAASPSPPSSDYPVPATANNNNKNNSSRTGDVCVECPATTTTVGVDSVVDGGAVVNSTTTTVTEEEEERAAPNGARSGGSAGCSPDPVAACITNYDFLMPERFCGRLIGRGGSFVNMLFSRTGVNVTLMPIPFRSNFKNCNLIGRPDQIKACLELIREKFPESKFPSVILEPASPLSVSIPESQQLHLPPGVTTAVLVSAVVTPGHLFVQQHSHPTYCSLRSLSIDLNQWYGTGEDNSTSTSTSGTSTAPPLPIPVPVGGVLVARAANAGWFRAVCVGAVQQMSSSLLEGATTETTTTESTTTKTTSAAAVCGGGDDSAVDSAPTVCGVPLRFADYGGYLTVAASDCRQMHCNFMSLPFQACECYLANIVPATEDGWTAESFNVMEELIAERSLEALVVTYAPDGVPCIDLYVVSTTQFGNSAISLVNQMLVDRGVARWMDHAPM